MSNIEIHGAKTHNLKDISLDIPRNKLVVITGISGSGKSSLAFDTLYAEGQRRYVESLSAYARQFLSLMEKPDVEHIQGLSPAISIQQKATSHNPRSTVGTITEIYDYLRLLFARAGQARCPEHDVSLESQSVSDMVDHALELPAGSKIMVLAPVVRSRKGEYQQLFKNLQQQGFIRARINGEIYELNQAPTLDKQKKHTIEVIVDRLKIDPEHKTRLAESFETALELADGITSISMLDSDHEDILFSANLACPICGYSLPELSPRLFSFNSPHGACSACDGIGAIEQINPDLIVHDPSLSIAQGAIRGWDKNHMYYYTQLCAVSEHFGFSIEVPFEELTKEQQHLILYGTGTEKLRMRVFHGTGYAYRTRAFKGVIPYLEHRHKEADSEAVREEIGKYMSRKTCSVCHGSRLCTSARHVYIQDKTIHELCSLPIEEVLVFFKQLKLKGYRAKVAEKVLKEIQQRLQFLINVGLEYLSLERRADTLSGGEAQRIRLASQVGAGLVGVMYILDEPSIGLHQRDNQKLLETLFHLRDSGNCVIVVEHDEDAIRQADHIIDIGPGAGVHGGAVIAQGPLDTILKNPKSITGQYLSGKQSIPTPKKRSKGDLDKMLTIKEACGHNLKNVSISIPLGVITCITGVSGSGKSTLINQTLYPQAAKTLNRATKVYPQPHETIEGFEHLDKVVNIDQSPIGRTPRSNPATYVGLFTPIRELFASTQEARARGYKPGRFSFNVKGGYCQSCNGDGVIKVEMHFLPDIYVPCDSCKGQRYNRETLEVCYKGKNIHEVLEMSVEQAHEFFSAVPSIFKKLDTLMQVGLSYIKLGQRATTLSGGEAQRIKLAKELSRRDTGNTLYILDEPTTGLHFHDIKQLLAVLEELRARGNTIVIIEHNLDVIKTADWIIDLGPEGGDKGGTILASGTPEQIAKVKASHTGKFLAPMLQSKAKAKA